MVGEGVAMAQAVVAAAPRCEEIEPCACKAGSYWNGVLPRSVPARFNGSSFASMQSGKVAVNCASRTRLAEAYLALFPDQEV